MAPPLKRRRLFFWQSETQEVSRNAELKMEARRPHGYAHIVAGIDATEPLDGEEDSAQHILERQVVDAVAATATDITIVAVDVATAVTTAIVSDISAAPAVSASLVLDVSASVSTSIEVGTSLPAASTSLPTAVLSSIINTASPSSGNTINTLLPTSTTLPLLSTTFLISPATSLSQLSSTSAITSTTSTSPTITSSASISSTSSSKNITVAENVLTSALNTTTISSTTPSIGTITSGFFANSSLTYSSPILTSTTDSSDGDVATSVVLTTATLSSDGAPVSTITTAVGAGAAGYGAQPTSGSTNSMGTGESSSPPPPPPGTIAGGVVGGAAGVAILLLVAMLFLRWYRKRAEAKHQALLPDLAGSYQDSPDLSRNGPGMAEQAGLRPWVAAIPAMLRHQSPRGTADAAALVPPQERGFQRVSGRKLPSAWSPGIEGPPGPMPYSDLHRGSGTSSYYPPSHGEAANPFLDSSEQTTPENEVQPHRQASEHMTLVPGPQRRPTIHNPQRHPAITGADTRIKHMSSVARTSGTATTLLSSDALLQGPHSGHFREDIS